MQSLEDTIGYQFTNGHLKDEALLSAGASVTDPSLDGDPKGNKRLALVGDAVLQLVILQRWYRSGANPAAGNRMLQRLASNTALSAKASTAHLQDVLVKNPCHKGQTPEETLAATVEALIGAVWFDCDGRWDLVEGVMEKLDLFHGQ